MNTLVFIIGKNPSAANGEIPISLTDPRDEISDNHCKITFDGLNYVLEDLNSEKGTFVNNRQILGKMIITPEDKISLGPNYNFSILHPTIQSMVNKTFFDGQAVYKPVAKEKPKMEKVKMLITKKEAASATVYLIISVLIDFFTLFMDTHTRKAEFNESLLDFASTGSFLLAIYILYKYFKSYNKKDIVFLIKLYVIVGWVMNFLSLFGALLSLERRPNGEIISILYTLVLISSLTFFVIGIILGIKLIIFNKDKTRLLRPFGIALIVINFLTNFIGIIELLNNSDSMVFTTLIWSVQPLILMAFYIKLKNVYPLKEE